MRLLPLLLTLAITVAHAQSTVALVGVPSERVAQLLACPIPVRPALVTYSGKLDCDTLYRITDTRHARYELRITIERDAQSTTQQAQFDLFAFIRAILSGKVDGISASTGDGSSIDRVQVALPIDERIDVNYGGSIYVPSGDKHLSVPYGLTITGTLTGGYKPVVDVRVSLSTANTVGGVVTTTGSTVNLTTSSEASAIINIGSRQNSNQLGLPTATSTSDQQSRLIVTVRLHRVER